MEYIDRMFGNGAVKPTTRLTKWASAPQYVIPQLFIVIVVMLWLVEDRGEVAGWRLQGEILSKNTLKQCIGQNNT